MQSCEVAKLLIRKFFSGIITMNKRKLRHLSKLKKQINELFLRGTISEEEMAAMQPSTSDANSSIDGGMFSLRIFHVRMLLSLTFLNCLLVCLLVVFSTEIVLHRTVSLQPSLDLYNFTVRCFGLIF